MKEIFLQSNNGCFSNDVENKLNVNFSTKVRLLPNNDISKEFSLNEQYNKERDECERFRIILGINPICSNVLFNPKTEIVINEGSSATTVICDCASGSILKNKYASGATNSKNTISYIDAIRNTEYSHSELGNFKYHCGFDIFNNHMLRKSGFNHINKLSSIPKHGDTYNTISDYLRDKLGNEIKQRINVRYNETGLTEMHLYNFDSMLSMKQAFLERCEEVDGWWGFINPTNINIPNRDNEYILTNRLMNDRKSCDFIDLYPDRSLYSFIPKYNKFRNRLEKNWDYCITYPFENDYDKINEVCGGEKSSIKASFMKKNNSSGLEVLECYSYFKHNLKPNDYINIYFYGNGDFQLYNKTVKIESIGDNVGDNSDRIFTIKFNDISSLYDFIFYTEEEKKSKKTIYDGNLFFKKVTNGNECQYYFRKFKKLKNIDGSDLKSDINKIAFGKTIYGDDVAQVIFTDDINVNGLLDNNNRPLTKVYFTVIKRNAGHDIWYKDYKKSTDDGGKNGSEVEYSHCFGRVTSGLDFTGMKEEPFDYNIHRMHNLDFHDSFENAFNIKNDRIEVISYNNGSVVVRVWDDLKSEDITINIGSTNGSEIRTFLMWGESVLSLPKTIDNSVINVGNDTKLKDTKGITIDDDEFYGDVVEYDNTNCVETIISNVYHRVNTAQRECFDKCFRDIIQDVIIYDDYDKNVVEDAKEFTVKSYYMNDVINSDSERNNFSTDTNLIFGNIMPEGNFYNPHTQINLRAEDSIISNSPAKLVNYGEAEIVNGNLMITVPTNFGFYKGDFIAFYNSENNNTIWGEIVKTENNGFKLEIKVNVKNLILSEFLGPNRKYKGYWSPNNVPVYAKFLPKSRKFVWRRILGQSELNSNNPLYEMTFSNGRLYVEKNINFFLRRQDPFGKYGLSRPLTGIIGKQYTNPSDDYSIPGDKQVDFTGILYSINNFDNCY